jgi:hypothetical protein
MNHYVTHLHQANAAGVDPRVLAKATAEGTVAAAAQLSDGTYVYWPNTGSATRAAIINAGYRLRNRSDPPAY